MSGNKPNGTLYIVTAPSGAGKTTLVAGLLERDPQVHLSISYTTRAPRPGETDGRDYHFIDVPRFLAMRDAGEFIESAEVYGNYYGTSRPWLEQRMATGQDVLLEIDWQGARLARVLFPEAIGVFILPPSYAELERRLTARGQDSAEIIARRMAAAREEMRHVSEFDYVIINNDLQEALADLLVIVRAARLRYPLQLTRHHEYFTFLEQD